VAARYIAPDIHVFFGVTIIGDPIYNRQRLGIFWIYNSTDNSIQANYDGWLEPRMIDTSLRARGGTPIPLVCAILRNNLFIRILLACSNDTECLVVWSGRTSESIPPDDRTIYAGITFLKAENSSYLGNQQYANNSFIVNFGENDGFYDDFPTVASLNNDINATMKSFFIAWETNNTKYKRTVFKFLRTN